MEGTHQFDALHTLDVVIQTEGTFIQFEHTMEVNWMRMFGNGAVHVTILHCYERALALAMAFHPRLGAGSSLSSLTPDVLRLV